MDKQGSRVQAGRAEKRDVAEDKKGRRQKRKEKQESRDRSQPKTTPSRG